MCKLCGHNVDVCSLTAFVCVSPASILDSNDSPSSLFHSEVEALTLFHAVNKWESEIRPLVSLSSIQGPFILLNANCPKGCPFVLP